MNFISRNLVKLSKLCSAGGSKSYPELLETAHLSNPFTGNVVEAICQPIVPEFDSLL